MKTHLRYSLDQAYDAGENGHAQQVMKRLGIAYSLAVPQSVCDQWWFFDCKNVPANLPKFISPLGLKPSACVGYGLTEREARQLGD